MLVLLALCVPAQGQMYRWPDKDGRIHYSDVPPPGAKGEQRAAKPAAARTPAQAQDATGGSKSRQALSDNAELAGGRFRPEEELAAGVVCRIALMEGRHCATPLNRYCSLDELVKGVEGNRAIAFKDPRTDSNYQYRVDIRGNTVAISADARKPGLAGFFSEGDEIRYNTRGSAGKTDKRVKVGANCLGFSR
jgi:Domain of unknown function (DUF4124)